MTTTDSLIAFSIIAFLGLMIYSHWQGQTLAETIKGIREFVIDWNEE